jgi:phosphopantothenoylcysteine decarboxylase/phosphopantothenate--cysteine ligase
MHAAVHRQIAAHAENAADLDVFIAVAAVADYRPATFIAQKIKKAAQAAPPMIELRQNPDILGEVAALPKPPLCVGFAAESENLAAYAENKRRRKGIPLIVGNLIHDGFGGDRNTLILFDDDGQHPLAPDSKLRLARQLVARIATLLEKRR